MMTRHSDWGIYPPIRFLTPRGAIFLDVPNPLTRSAIGIYWNAVRRYLHTGNDDALRPFRGWSITVAGVRYPYITDPDLLERLGNAGEIRFEDLYPLTN